MGDGISGGGGARDGDGIDDLGSLVEVWEDTLYSLPWRRSWRAHEGGKAQIFGRWSCS